MARPKNEVQTVESMINLQKEMNDFTVDKIESVAPKQEEFEPQVKLSMKEIAKMEGIPYIEPYRTLPAVGVLPDKWKKMHAEDWEYVKGIFENTVSPGESICFSLCLWPGDKDCSWRIPANRVVYVPRMVARLLSGEKHPHLNVQALKYHTFNYIERPSVEWSPDQFTHNFNVLGTFSRGNFRAVGAF